MSSEALIRAQDARAALANERQWPNQRTFEARTNAALDAIVAEVARLDQALADALTTDWNGVRGKAEEQVARLQQERDAAKRQVRVWKLRDDSMLAARAERDALAAELAAARAREQGLREAFSDLERNMQRHMEDCCRTDIEWKEQMATHNAASSALGRARAALAAEPAATLAEQAYYADAEGRFPEAEAAGLSASAAADDNAGPRPDDNTVLGP